MAWQFRSTRDAVCSNPFSEWLWGGMQYQLEHHLFPTMPVPRPPARLLRKRPPPHERGTPHHAPRTMLAHLACALRLLLASVFVSRMPLLFGFPDASQLCFEHNVPSSDTRADR